MKKNIKILLAALTCAALLVPCQAAKADTISGAGDWEVKFTSDKKMNSNFQSGQFNDVLDYMQPGDTAEFTVTLSNKYNEETDWYMTNEVIKSLEDNSKTASSGAYSYRLVYVDPSNVESVLYDSEKIGGEIATRANSKVGLNEATDNLDQYFYLDTLQAGKTGYVKLRVGLDGETQGNSYQDTLARLQMNFAVELPTDNPEIEYRQTERKVYKDRRVVSTGDESDMSIFYIAAVALAALCIFTGVMGVATRRKERA